MLEHGLCRLLQPPSFFPNIFFSFKNTFKQEVSWNHIKKNYINSCLARASVGTWHRPSGACLVTAITGCFPAAALSRARTRAQGFRGGRRQGACRTAFSTTLEIIITIGRTTASTIPVCIPGTIQQQQQLFEEQGEAVKVPGSNEAVMLSSIGATYWHFGPCLEADCRNQRAGVWHHRGVTSRSSNSVSSCWIARCCLTRTGALKAGSHFVMWFKINLSQPSISDTIAIYRLRCKSGKKVASFSIWKYRK